MIFKKTLAPLISIKLLENLHQDIFVDIGILKPKRQNITSIELKQNEMFVHAKDKLLKILHQDIFVDFGILKTNRQNITSRHFCSCQR